MRFRKFSILKSLKDKKKTCLFKKQKMQQMFSNKCCQKQVHTITFPGHSSLGAFGKKK